MPVVKYNNTKKMSSNPSGSQSLPWIEIAQWGGTIRTHHGPLIPHDPTIVGNPQHIQELTGDTEDDVFSSPTLFTDTPTLPPILAPPAKPSHIRDGISMKSFGLAPLVARYPVQCLGCLS